MTNPPASRPPPLQFNLRTMLGVTAAFGLVFAVLRWMGAPPEVSLLVLVLMGVTVVAAVGLVVVLAGAASRPPDEPPESERPAGPKDESAKQE